MPLRLEFQKRQPEAPSSPVALPAAPNTPESGAFSGVLERFALEAGKGERLISRALSAPSVGLDAGALIALQAGIYRYSEALDLAGKAVERTTGALRTVLQSPGH